MERYKPQSQWSVAEIVAARRDGIIPETSEYIEARAKALSDAGLEAEDAAGEDRDEQGLTTDAHLRRIQRGRV